MLGTSLALSEEIVLDRVIETLMTRMLVHAGANRGLLLKIADGQLEAEASAWTEGDSVRVSTHCGPWPASQKASIDSAWKAPSAAKLVARMRRDMRSRLPPICAATAAIANAMIAWVTLRKTRIWLLSTVPS